GAGGRVALLQRDVFAEPAGDELAAHERQLARDVREVARDDDRDVGGDGRGGGGKLDAELGEAVLDGHRRAPCNVSSSHGKASVQVSMRAWAWPASKAQGMCGATVASAHRCRREIPGSSSAADARWLAMSSMNTARVGACCSTIRFREIGRAACR